MYINFILKSSCVALIIFLIISSCTDKSNPVEGGGADPGFLSAPPYYDPIWHPNGKFIGFNHTPLIRIDYSNKYYGVQHFNRDSTGFWLINPDGTNMRRIFPYTLLAPSWSPDGQWIAFVANAQIYKMRFTGTTFDTTTLTQLTTVGRNFFPSWSPDGEWIAYNKSICEGPNTCGIWLMKSDGTQHKFLASYGNSPNWHRSEKKILYLTRAVTSRGEVIGDSLWSFDTYTNAKSFLVFLTGKNLNNRYPKYSPDGTKIAFWSSGNKGNIWIMDTTGTNQRQLTAEGVEVNDDIFSWSPDGKKIVYTQHNYNKWNYDNGVLWIIDINTGAEYQLTFNLSK